MASEVGLVTDIFPLIDWLAASFLNPDWFTKLARPILVTNCLSRQPKSHLSFLSMGRVRVRALGGVRVRVLGGVSGGVSS